MCSVKETQCTRCARLQICSCKKEFLAVQEAVDRVAVVIDGLAIRNLQSFKWIKPVSLECALFEARENGTDDLEKAIQAVAEMDTQPGVAQSVYVVEECSELIKELMKQQRGKGYKEDILAEACDVLTTVFVLLTQCGVSRDFVKSQILYKCNRALDRYRKTGEV